MRSSKSEKEIGIFKSGWNKKFSRVSKDLMKRTELVKTKRQTCNRNDHVKISNTGIFSDMNKIIKKNEYIWFSFACKALSKVNHHSLA